MPLTLGPVWWSGGSEAGPEHARPPCWRRGRCGRPLPARQGALARTLPPPTPGPTPTCSNCEFGKNSVSERKLGVGGGLYLGTANFSVTMSKLQGVSGCGGHSGTAAAAAAPMRDRSAAGGAGCAAALPRRLLPPTSRIHSRHRLPVRPPEFSLKTSNRTRRTTAAGCTLRPTCRAALSWRTCRRTATRRRWGPLPSGARLRLRLRLRRGGGELPDGGAATASAGTSTQGAVWQPTCH